MYALVDRKNNRSRRGWQRERGEETFPKIRLRFRLGITWLDGSLLGGEELSMAFLPGQCCSPDFTFTADCVGENGIDRSPIRKHFAGDTSLRPQDLPLDELRAAPADDAGKGG